MQIWRCRGAEMLRCKGADKYDVQRHRAQMCRDVDMEVLRCRDGAGAGKEVQRLYKGAKEVQMQRKCRGGKEQVQRC